MYFRRLLERRDSLEVKKIIKIKFEWIIAATTGRFYEWAGVFSEKCLMDNFSGNKSMAVAPNSSLK